MGHKSIEVTEEMERAGVSVLEEFGLLENGLFKVSADRTVIREIFTAMIEARVASDRETHSSHAK